MPRSLLLLLLALALAGCPTPSVDDDDSVADDDDSVADDDDSVADDDDSVADDDDSVADDDDSVGDDDDSAGDDDDSVGDDDDSAGDDDDSAGDDDDSTSAPDADGDGVGADTDCDDSDPANYPGNTEVCDGADNDCDPSTWATDEDVDIDSDGVAACLDCDDSDPANFPGNAEVCDGADNDCDATTFATDEDTDLDNDGAATCLDCDDADPANFPGNTEVCDGADNDCDATTFATSEDADGDSDGAPACLDCDDGDPNNYPGNTEVCDAVDNDCDPSTWAVGEDTDADNDGAVTCLDCDDANVENTPGGIEVCDGADNDCDATTFADAAGEVDADSDGSLSCADCDDADGANYPGNTEVCDQQDNDCNGFADALGGVPDAWSTSTNSAISNLSFTKGNIFTASASATITAWGMDLDADGAASLTLTIGEGTSPTGPFTIVSTVALGVVPTGRQVHSSGAISVPVTAGNHYWIGATWTGGSATNYFGSHASDPAWGSLGNAAWNSITGVPTTGWTPETTLGSSNSYSMAIEATVTGDSELADADGDLSTACLDCDDNDATNTPGATELCDGADNDCDATTWADAAGEVDADSDGSLSCLDCDDSDGANTPGGAEVCDGADNDCDATTVFAGEDVDADSDGSIACFDCDDADGDNYPGNTELCDGADNDCDGTFDASVEFRTTFTVTGTGGPDWVRGGRFLATDDALLHTVDYYLGGQPGDVVTWLVYEGTIEADPSSYTLVGQSTTTLTNSTTEWKSSSPVDLPLSAGSYYIFAAHYTASAVVGGAGSYPWPEAAGPLTYQAGVYADNVTSPPASGATLQFNSANADAIGFTLVGEGDVDGDSFLGCEDCDDTDASIYPGQTELCDGLDNDCDATTAAAGGEDDVDLDGSVSCLDCDDNDATTFPSAPELCDGADNNCDGLAAETSVLSLGQSLSGTGRFRGNRIEPSSHALLSEFCLDLNAPTGAVLTFGVWESTTANGTYTNIASQEIEVSGLVGGVANPICAGGWDLELEAGLHYALLAWWNANTNVTYHGGITPPTATWGTIAGSLWQSSATFPATIDGSSNFNGSYSGSITMNDEGDFDSDTWLACADCDDGEALVAPDGVEDCDELDNDCSGAIDVFAASGSNSTPASPDTTNNWVVSRTIEIPENAPIADVNVIVDIAHTHTDDLSITLTSPSGTVVDLSTNNGGSGADYQVTTFDDEAATPITAGAAPFAGSYSPEEPLAAFDGELSAGTWTLTVTDDMPGAVDGTLNLWVLDVTMDGGACLSASCLEELTANAGSIDGTYLLNPTGVQGDADEYVCDMTNGGWTQVFFNDFDTVGPDPLWSQQTTYDCAGDILLGGYNVFSGGTQTFLLDLSMHTHTEARVQTEYWAIDSWDGETAWIDIDGANLWFTTVSNGALGSPNLCGAGNTGWTEDIFAIDQSFAHSGGTLFYSAGSNLNQGPNDESFAVDDVYVWVR